MLSEKAGMERVCMWEGRRGAGRGRGAKVIHSNPPTWFHSDTATIPVSDGCGCHIVAFHQVLGVRVNKVLLKPHIIILY